MSQQHKPQDNNKPQPTTEQKPAPAPAKPDFTTKTVFVGDSADNINRKGK
ncbi:TPA: hypothetical protein ACS8DH_000833 [Providencia alcalifaciens]